MWIELTTTSAPALHPSSRYMQSSGSICPTLRQVSPSPLFIVRCKTDQTSQLEHVIGLMVLGTAEGAITIMAVSIPVLRTFKDDRTAEVVGMETRKT